MNTNLACYECGNLVLPDQQNMMCYNYTHVTPCVRCGAPLRITKVNVVISDECIPLTGGAVYDVTWYHLTESPVWYRDVVNADVMVHVGTLHTVEEYYFQKIGSRLTPPKLWLFELNLSPDAEIDSHLHRDTNDWDEFEIQQKNIRYLNKWEGPGQVSLLVHPKYLEVTSRTNLTKVDMFE